MNAWIADWLRAFAITLLVEAAVATPLLARVEARLGRRAMAVALVNLATHPLVWFLFPGIAAPHAIRLALSEAWAFAAEAVGYAVVWPGIGARRALLVSLLANGASLAVGLLLSGFSRH